MALLTNLTEGRGSNGVEMVGGAANRKHLDRYLRSPAGTPVVQVEMQAHAGIGEERHVCMGRAQSLN